MSTTEQNSDSGVSGVGVTALWIAALRSLASSQPDPIIQDNFSKSLAGKEGFDFINILDGVDNETINKRIYTIAKRTFILDLFLKEAIQNNVKQIVNLGSGLDTKPYRLNFLSDVMFYEIDVPAVINYKKRILNKINATPKCKLITIGIDLTKKDEWVSQLLQSGFDNNKPSVFITEGLLYYLQDEDVANILKSISKLSVNGSFFIGDMLSTFSFNGLKVRAMREKFIQNGFDFNSHSNDMRPILNKYGFEGKNVIYSAISPKKYQVTDAYKIDGLYQFIGIKKDYTSLIKSKL